MMLQKDITFYGQNAGTLVCDGRCDKAWGINSRPKKSLSDDPDDFVYLSDDELGTAPPPGWDVGYEGGHTKPSAEPQTDGDVMNKWCARECERSRRYEVGEDLVVVDLRNPSPNIPR